MEEQDLERYSVTIQSPPTQFLRWKRMNMVPLLPSLSSSHHPLLSWDCRTRAVGTVVMGCLCIVSAGMSKDHVQEHSTLLVLPGTFRREGTGQPGLEGTVRGTPLSSSIGTSIMTDAGAPLL